MKMKGAYNLIFIIACYFIVNGIYVPAMPNVAEYFHAGGGVVRQSMTLFQLGALISCIAAGFFADSIGKKKFVILGLFTAFAGSCLCLIAPSLNLLMIGRFIQGIGAATGFMMGFALAVDLYEPKETLKIIALNGIIVACASTFAPYIGGYLTHIWGWRVTFLLMAPLFVIALLNTIKSIPKHTPLHNYHTNMRQSLKEYIQVATNKTYLCYAALNSIYIGGLTFSISYLPFFYKNTLNLQESYIGLIIGAAIWLPFGITSIGSTLLYEQFGIEKSIYFALCLSLCGAIIVGLTAYVFQDAIIPNLIGTIMYFLGFGLMYSGSISKSLSVFMNLTTKASSLRTIMISVFAFIGGVGAQYASDKNLMHYALMLVFTTGLAAVFFFARGSNQPDPNENNH